MNELTLEKVAKMDLAAAQTALHNRIIALTSRFLTLLESAGKIGHGTDVTNVCNGLGVHAANELRSLWLNAEEVATQPAIALRVLDEEEVERLMAQLRAPKNESLNHDYDQIVKKRYLTPDQWIIEVRKLVTTANPAITVADVFKIFEAGSDKLAMLHAAFNDGKTPQQAYDLMVTKTKEEELRREIVEVPDDWNGSGN
jgi:hypothetical protein